MMRDVEIETLRNRIAQLAAEGREREREGTAWLLADVIMRGPADTIGTDGWRQRSARRKSS